MLLISGNDSLSNIHIQIDDAQTFYFTALFWLSPTTNVNTPILARPERFFFYFASIAKYLDEIFPKLDDPRYPF